MYIRMCDARPDKTLEQISDLQGETSFQSLTSYDRTISLIPYHIVVPISAIREFPHLQRSGALEKATSGLQGMSSCSTPMNMLLTVSDSYATIEEVSQAAWYACGV